MRVWIFWGSDAFLFFNESSSLVVFPMVTVRQGICCESFIWFQWPPHPFILSPILPLPCPSQGLACDHLEKLALQVCLGLPHLVPWHFLVITCICARTKQTPFLSVMFLWLLGIGPFVVWPVVSIPLEVANANNLLYHVQVGFKHLLRLRRVACWYLVVLECAVVMWEEKEVTLN